MTPSDDALLLEHYIHRGHESWNVSLEASYLDYELRRCLLERMPAKRPLRVCNIGIGVGLWDDWLGYVAGASITSVDRDRGICEVFALRQKRERHPHPSHVICGDVLAGILDGLQFDLVTCVGSTLGESGDRPGLHQAMLAALAPDGVLFEAEVRESAGLPGVALACTFTGADGRPIHDA
jgi:hypothetical protein